MRLTPMVDLMLEQMKQQPVDPFMLDPITTMDIHNAIEIGRAQALDDGNQSPVHLALRIPEDDAVSQGSGPAQAAGPSVPPSIAST